MNAKRLKSKVRLFVIVTVVYTVVALLGWLILGLLLPVRYFVVYPAISVFYWIMGLILTYVLDSYKDKNPEKLITAFMLTKTIKFVVTVLFLLLYVKFSPGIKMPFSIALFCNYFIYSILEMYIYAIYNKYIGQSNNKSQDATEK